MKNMTPEEKAAMKKERGEKMEKAKEKCKGMGNVYVNDFITQMEYGYAAADIVISRSGAMAISELCIVAKPVIFVPYPFAAEDHQTVNATTLVNKNAAIMIENKDVQTKLIDEILNFSNFFLDYKAV